jgi:ribose 5-phosphate isomerase B
MDNLRYVIDADDAAVNLKNEIYAFLAGKGWQITDLQYASVKKGAYYPEIAANLARQIQAGEYDRGILLCGTGLGMSIVANKFKGVYAGLCHDVYSAERLAKSNDANVLTMGARVIGVELAKKIVEAWMDSKFVTGGSSPKVEQMRAIEEQNFMDTDK